ncbi:MAG TPA: hypothetical protein VGA67_03390, partial [Candidatus Dojkabacteria bacterium]
MKISLLKKSITLTILISTILSYFTPILPFLNFTKAADYSFSVVSFGLPAVMEINESLSVPINLENTGELDWTSDIKLSYKWYASGGGVISGGVTDLVADVLAGSLTSPTQTIEVIAPPGEGNYNLKVDLYSGGAFLDVESGSFAVIVEDNTPPPTPAPPTGTITIDGGEVEAFDTDLIINLDVFSEDTVNEMLFSSLSDFSDTNWEAYNPQLQETIPDITGIYSYFVKFRDSLGQESEVYSDSIEYVKYLISPMLVAEVREEPLLGDDMVVDVTIKNEGEDTGYNASLALTLPSGITFIEALVPETTQYDPVVPNYVSDTQIRWESFTDLLPGEEYRISFRLGVAGEPTFYIDDLLSFDVSGILYKQPNFPTGFESSTNISSIIQAYRIEGQAADHTSDGQAIEQVTGVDDYKLDRKIVIKNNADVDSNKEVEDSEGNVEEKEVVIREILDPGLEYILGSETVENLFGELISFRVIEDDGDNDEDTSDDFLILEWIIEGLTSENNENPLTIGYQIGIPYAKREGFDVGGDENYDNNGDPIEDDEILGIKTEIYASYRTRESADQEINKDSETKIEAKYIKINKYPDKHEVNPGDIVTYTVDIYTSQYYDFSSIYVDDLLPDGLQFISSDYEINEGFPVLNPDGTTNLQWLIVTLENSSKFTITYQAQVLESYFDGEDVLANDFFNNKIDVEGIWGDEITPGRTGEDGDNDGAATRTFRPEMLFEVYDEVSDTWVLQKDVTIGDIVKIKLSANFPQEVPTEKVEINNYIPPFTRLIPDSREISVSSDSDFENNPYTSNTVYPRGENFNFGRVEKAASWEMVFDIEILDEEALRDGVLIRDLARLFYTNSDETKKVDLDQATLRIIEPEIKVKKTRDSFLAAGNEVMITVEVINEGTSGAFDLNFFDTLPFNTEYVEESLTADANCEITWNSILEVFESQTCTILPDEKIEFTYKIRINNDVITGTSLFSKVVVSDYLNREIDSENLTRIYPSYEHEFDWKGVEGAFVTDVRLTDMTGNSMDGIGREEEFKIVNEVKNVGGAPVFDISLVESLFESDPEINFLERKVYVDNTEVIKDPDSTDGTESTWLFEELNPNKSIRIEYLFKTSSFLEFDNEYIASLSAEGKNYLDELIRKDASAELNKDTDPDDSDELIFVSMQKDFTPPTGSILFKNGLGEVIQVSNDISDVFVEYSASDNILEGLRGARFKDSESDEWILINELDQSVDCDIWAECNIWDGTLFQKLIDQNTKEGKV